MKLFLVVLAHLLNALPKTDRVLLHWCDLYGKYGLNAPNLVGMASAPTVTTDATPSSITTSSAVFDTNSIDNTGGENASVRGICYVSGAGGTPTTANTVVSTSGSYATGNFSATMSGLASGTTYSVRAFATNSAGTGYGSTVEVTTLTGIPTVTTGTDGSVTSTTATISTNNVSSTNGGTINSYGVVWNTSGAPTISDNKVETGTSFTTGNYNTNLTGLPVNTLVYFRAYATTAQGTGYGTTDSFTTLNQTPPTVALNSPADASSDSDTTPTLSFTGTDAQSDDIRYNVQISGLSSFASAATYYFDGSDAGATDPNGVFFDDANALDGSTSTSAYTFTEGSVSSNFLLAEGTNAPSAGGSITQVRARVNGSGLVESRAAIYTNGLTELLGTPTQAGFSQGWGSYVTLSTPSGGWTWSDVQSLETKLYSPDANSGVPYWYRIEIEVTSLLLDKLSGTDSGFSGSPDNTDPFTSGQQVSYTVQAGDELDPGTYYWRVRGIDPSGTNTYGAWSSTRSFTINTPPTVVLNSPADASSTTDTTPTLGFTGTDAESDDVRYEVQVSPTNIFEGIVDVDNVWSNDNNIADGSTATAASTTTAGSSSSNEIIIKGTTASSGGTITQVRSRKYAGQTNTSPGFGAYNTLSTPSGGWTWEKIKKLEARVYAQESFGDKYSNFQVTTESNGEVLGTNTSGGFGSGDVEVFVHRVEIEVTHDTVDTYYFDGSNGPIISATSNTDSGFVNPVNNPDTDPFTSGDPVEFTVQAGDELAAGTYYWRVRGIDPSGSNSYGAWSDTRSFEVTSSGTTLVIPDTASITTVDNVALTQKHTLVVNNLASTTQSDTPTLTQKYTLTVADLDSTTQSDNAVLTQSVTLSVDEATSVTTVDNSVLTQKHNLAVAELTSTTQSDNVALIQKNTLVVVDLASITAVDNITLTQSVTLSVDEMTSLTQTDNTTLTQKHVLSVDEAFSPTTLDDTALTQKSTIALDDLASTTASDTPTLVQSAILTVQESASDTVVESVALTQKHTLSVQDATSITALDNVLLTQKHLLAVNELTSTTSADNIELSQSIILTVADSDSLTTVDNLELAQKNTLEVQDAASTTQSDNVTVSHKSTLEVADLTSTTTLDPIELFVNTVTLSIDDLTSETTVDNTGLSVALTLELASLFSDTALESTAVTQKHTLSVNDLTSQTTIDNVKFITYVEERSYYIDTDGNVYWVVNQELGLVEKI